MNDDVCNFFTSLLTGDLPDLARMNLGEIEVSYSDGCIVILNGSAPPIMLERASHSAGASQPGPE